MSESSAPIHVLLFVDNFDIGGTQKHCVQLANALAADPDFRVAVGCLKKRGKLLGDLQLPPELVTAYPLKRFYDARGVKQIIRLGRAAARLRFDIVHAHDFYANVICAAASCLSPFRLVVGRRYLRLSERRSHSVGERWCYRLADAVVLNSRSIADQLIRRGQLSSKKAVIIPNGIELDRLSLEEHEVAHPTDSAGPRLGVVASLCADKDHETLIRAVARLRPRWPRLELVLVGDGELRKQLEALAASLNLQKRVKFVGWQADVRPWIRTFDIAVLPSRREGMPNALLEYLAMGRPVVATAVGGIPEVVEDGREALLVPPADPARLAAAIDRLLADDGRRADMGEAARRRAERYRLEETIESYRRLYRRLLEEHAPLPPWRRSLHAIGETTGVRSVW